MEQIVSIFEIYGDKIKSLGKGEEITVECPFCGGQMHICKSSYNGHLRIFCDGRDFCLVQ